MSNNNNNTRQRPSTSTEEKYRDIYEYFEDAALDALYTDDFYFTDADNADDAADHYRWEDRLFDDATDGERRALMKSAALGAGVALLGFAGLRARAARATAGVATRNSGFHSNSGYRSGPTPPPPTPPPSSSSSGSGYQFDRTPSYNSSQRPSTTFGTLPHVLLSTSLGILTALTTFECGLLHTDDEAIPPAPWIDAVVPLVPGRSMLSDKMCGHLTREFRNFPKDTWKSEHMGLLPNGGWKDTKYYDRNVNASVVALGEKDVGGSSDGGIGGSIGVGGGGAGNNNSWTDGRGEYESLVDSLQGFVINCERRRRYEEKVWKLRGNHGSSSTASTVVVPEGGVPAHEEMELDDLYHERSRSTKDKDREGYYGAETYYDHDGAGAGGR